MGTRIQQLSSFSTADCCHVELRRHTGMPRMRRPMTVHDQASLGCPGAMWPFSMLASSQTQPKQLHVQTVIHEYVSGPQNLWLIIIAAATLCSTRSG